MSLKTPYATERFDRCKITRQMSVRCHREFCTAAPA